MADSNITKRALAASLRALMADIPFEKISVAHICENCDMNRKSFYYHFKDKYDLVNWIYDTEFLAIVSKTPLDTGWDFLQRLCGYLYENRDFYRKALNIKGQNAFSEHFREMQLPVVKDYLRKLTSGQEPLDFQVNFFSDGFVCAIERWIQDKNSIPPEEFTALLKSCIYQAAAAATAYRDSHP